MNFLRAVIIVLTSLTSLMPVEHSANLSAANVTLHFNSAWLLQAGHRIEPMSVYEDGMERHLVGGRWVTVDGNAVHEIDGESRRILWSIESPSGELLAWLGSDEEVAYFAMRSQMTDQTSHERRHARSANQTRIARLSLNSPTRVA